MNVPTVLEDGTTVAVSVIDPVVTIPPPTTRFPGDVAAGTVRWGAAIAGNADPVARHESIAGVPMGLRRTFWGWCDAKAVSTAKADIGVGRLPWVSIKTPGWQAVAAGNYDSQLDAFLKALDACGGPVWFTVHHEPENDDFTTGPATGGAPAWRAMQTHVRDRIKATGVRNVAFASVLMSWTFDSRSGRKPADWWVDGIWDLAGIDHYVENAAETSMDIPMWNNAKAFYKAKGLPIAVAEWGNRGVDAEAAGDMQEFYDESRTSDRFIVGLSYFDSGLNSATGSWELMGLPLDKFRQLMKAPTSVRLK